MRPAPPSQCSRCESRDCWDVPPAWLPWLQRAWFVGLLLLLPLTPVLMSDVMVLLPALAVYMLGAGPALAAGNRECVCRHCGAVWVPPPSRLSAWWRARRLPHRPSAPHLTLAKSAPPPGDVGPS